MSRLVSYKKTEQLIKAFEQFPELELVVAGDGPNRKKLEQSAPKNVKILWDTLKQISSSNL